MDYDIKPLLFFVAGILTGYLFFQTEINKTYALVIAIIIVSSVGFIGIKKNDE